MKRSYLKRSQKPMKRSPLRKQSSKKRKMNNEYRDEREAFKAELGCPCGRVATDTHEIAAGSSRTKAFGKRFAWLALCRECHERIQGSDMATQYAMKALQDSEEFYQRVELNRLRGRADDAISEIEVVRAAYELGRSER